MMFEQASFALYGHAKELTHLPQSGSKLPAHQNSLFENHQMLPRQVMERLDVSEI